MSTAVVYAVVLVFNRLERVDAEWLAIVVTWIGSQLFLLLSGFALRSALRRTPTSEWNIFAVLGAGFLIAVLHSELTEELLIFQGVPIAPTSDWFHVVAGLFGVVVYYLFAATWGSYRDWKETRSELSTTIAAIESLRSGAQDFHKAESEQLSQRIRETVLPGISAIQARLGERGLQLRAEVLDGIRQALEHDVRPLGRTLRTEEMMLPQATLGPPAALLRLPDRIYVRDLVQPELMVLFPGLLTVFEAMARPSPATPLFSLTSVLSTYAAMHALRLLLPRQATGRVRSLLMFTVVAIASNIPDLLLVQLATVPPEDAWSFVVAHDVSAPLFDAVVAYLLLLESNVSAARDLLSRAKRRLDDLRQRQTHRAWILRRNWSYLLHGQVQSALAAALVRIDMGAAPEPQLVDEVSMDLERACEAILSGPTEEVVLPDRLQQLSEIWSGICDISLDVDETTFHAVGSHQTLAFALNEMLTEAVSNAVRHGNATHVEVHIRTKSPDTVSVIVTNDGIAPTALQQASLGSLMMDELTLDWSLTHDVETGETKLQATVPF